MNKQALDTFKESLKHAEPLVDLTTETYTPYPYQKALIEKIMTLFQTVRMVSFEATGGCGKTSIGADIGARLNGNVVFISPNRDAYESFKRDFTRVYASYGRKVFVSSKLTVSADVHLMTHQALSYAFKRDSGATVSIFQNASLVVLDEAHRYPDDPEAETAMIGRIMEIVNKYAPQAKVLAMTGTFYRMDDKLPVGVKAPDFKITMQDMIVGGFQPDLHGIATHLDIEVNPDEIDMDHHAKVINLNFCREKLVKYLNLIADTAIAIIGIEAESQQAAGATKPGGHCFFFSRQDQAISFCEIMNERLGWKAFVAIVSDEVTKFDMASDIVPKLRSGEYLGYATVAKGVESLNIPRLKYCHMVVRTSSDVKLMQAVFRIMRPGDDEDTRKVKSAACVIDYQLLQGRILKLARGLETYTSLGESTMPRDEVLNGGSLFNIRKPHPRIVGVKLEEYNEWLGQFTESQAEKNKRLLLEMAARGDPRPTKSQELGAALIGYTNASQERFDSVFNDEIRKAAPTWFDGSNSLTSAEKRAALLEMARSGQRRPSKASGPLGITLSNLNNKRSRAYDPEFINELRELAPAWFDPKVMFSGKHLDQD